MLLSTYGAPCVLPQRKGLLGGSISPETWPWELHSAPADIGGCQGGGERKLGEAVAGEIVNAVHSTRNFGLPAREERFAVPNAKAGGHRD